MKGFNNYNRLVLVAHQQIVNFVNPTPPQVVLDPKIILACENFEVANQELRRRINFTHPCSRPINMTYTDSIVNVRCGITFTRTWLIEDDCNQKASAQQAIQILDLQLPDYPHNGQVNVNLFQSLSWPQYPRAITYHLYLYQYGQLKPNTPTITTRQRTYYPSQRYPSNTKMLWQVNYVLTSGILIPSPVWGFRTRAYPDFTVQTVTVPPRAFSGQTFEVSWTVMNSGGAGNAVFYWHDAVYIGKTIALSDARRITNVRQNRILYPGDGYTAKATLHLRNEDLGTFYVFVLTDFSRAVSCSCFSMFSL